MKYLIPILACLMLAGCGEEFAAGVGTGLLVNVQKANEVAAELAANTEVLAAKNREIKAFLNVIAKSDPLVVAGLLDPELKSEIDKFIANLYYLKEDAETFKDEKGKVDWVNIGLTLLLGGYTGGTGVNLYKNRKKVGG